MQSTKNGKDGFGEVFERYAALQNAVDQHNLAEEIGSEHVFNHLCDGAHDARQALLTAPANEINDIVLKLLIWRCELRIDYNEDHVAIADSVLDDLRRLAGAADPGPIDSHAAIAAFAVAHRPAFAKPPAPSIAPRDGE